MAILLDTCAALWIVGGSPLSDKAMAALEDERSAGRFVMVSPITAWEIGLLASRGRFASSYSPQKWFDRLIALDGIALGPLPPNVLLGSSLLPGQPPRDPADRIMIATSRDLDLTLMTRDRLILAYAEAGHVRALAC